MKRIKIYQILILLLVVISCGKDFLGTYPYDQRALSSFYKNPEDALEALVAAYDPIRWNYANHIVLISEVASDNCFGGADAGDDDRLQVWDNFDGALMIGPQDDTWDKYWEGIYRVNTLLDNYSSINWGDTPELAKQYKAEARFLRAYYYFDLMRLWGHIPLVDHVMTDPSMYYPTQVDPDVIYEFIANDLKYAADSLESIPYGAMPANSGGRVTKWAAEALMARVFLFYTGYYNETDLAGVVTKTNVRAYIDDVIEHSDHDLVPNYASLWMQSGDDYAGEDNIETVFAIKYTYEGRNRELYRNLGSNWYIMIAPKLGVGYNSFAQGWGAGVVNPQLYYDWPEGDTIRRNATIINWHTEIAARLLSNRTTHKEFTYFSWKKFVPFAVDGSSQTTTLGGSYIYDNYEDKPEIRYSDVLLMAAELHLDDDLGLAQTHFNTVRNRAYGGTAPVITLSNDDAGRRAILNERKYEFALEGQRYFDLLRFDGLGANLATAKEAIDWDESNPYYDSVQFHYNGNIDNIRNIIFRPETEGVFTIPETQIDLSRGTLVQNPGW